MKRTGLVACALAFSLGALFHLAGRSELAASLTARSAEPPASSSGRVPTTVGLNLFGIQTYNRQQVFANLIAQSEWFQTSGAQWTPLPVDQIDGNGWVRHLKPGQSAPRPLVIPPAPFRPMQARCTFAGTGELSVGGVARLTGQTEQSIDFVLNPTGAQDEGAWIQLQRTDPSNPLRDVDCRRRDTPAGARFDPQFLTFLSDFDVIRFMDWQRVNDNPRLPWDQRTRPGSASQVGPAGVSVEDMVDLANVVHADPWFTLPYHADETYMRGFAQLVHDRLDPDAKVYVELGNEVWNDIFPAAQDAEREGLARGLGDKVPMKARMERYAEQMIAMMKVWSDVFADRPGTLVRVAATQHANPDLARIVLGFRDAPAWVDALATAPYIWLELGGHRSADIDRVYAAFPDAVRRTLDMGVENQRIAASFGKRYIAYEGGQHLVTPDLELARAIQRDPRMEAAYTRYLTGWRDRFGDTLMLYGSTAPISQYGSWGLLEYAGQPLADAPKYRAVRRFLETRP